MTVAEVRVLHTKGSEGKMRSRIVLSILVVAVLAISCANGGAGSERRGTPPMGASTVEPFRPDRPVAPEDFPQAPPLTPEELLRQENMLKKTGGHLDVPQTLGGSEEFRPTGPPTNPEGASVPSPAP